MKFRWGTSSYFILFLLLYILNNKFIYTKYPNGSPPLGAKPTNL